MKHTGHSTRKTRKMGIRTKILAAHCRHNYCAASTASGSELSKQMDIADKLLAEYKL